MLPKKHLFILIRNFIVWSFAFAFWSLMRNFGQEAITPYNTIPLWNQILTHIVLGVLAGVLFGTLEILFDKYIFRKMRLLHAVIIASISHLIIIIVILFVAIIILTKTLNIDDNYIDYQAIFFSKQTILAVFYFSFVINLNSVFLEIDKKFGRGNLWKMFKGEFYYPKEENRIFMFIDLKSSTTIAEKIGHIQYSKFLQECFKDLSIVEKYDAEIYQYVGDEAVLTWKTKNGFKSNFCLKAFFAFQHVLMAKSDYYESTYGVLPEFKAGMHFGNIITAEVGELKREIAYHGDTINTAARIQEVCNLLDAQLLISSDMYNNIENIHDYVFEFKRELLLKGKTQKIKLYNVKEKQS